MSYKEQIFKELEKVKDSGGTATFDGINPKTVRHYAFIFNEVHNSDLACSINKGVATVSSRENKTSTREYVENELSKLTSIGEQLTLDGSPSTLCMYVCRLKRKFSLDLSTNVINGKLRVVVMGVKE